MIGAEARITAGLRWNDIDRVGHVNHTVYHALLEEVRFELLSPLMAHDEDSMFVLVRIELDHGSEVRRDEGPLEVVGHIEKLGTKSVVLKHDVHKADGTLAASGRSTLVAFDMVTRRAREITPEERTALGE